MGKVFNESLAYMCRTPGWKIVKDNTLARMETINKRLASTTFTSLSEVIELQVEYRALAGLLNQYDTREE